MLYKNDRKEVKKDNRLSNNPKKGNYSTEGKTDIRFTNIYFLYLRGMLHVSFSDERHT